LYFEMRVTPFDRRLTGRHADILPGGVGHTTAIPDEVDNQEPERGNAGQIRDPDRILRGIEEDRCAVEAEHELDERLVVLLKVIQAAAAAGPVPEGQAPQDLEGPAHVCSSHELVANRRCRHAECWHSPAVG